MTRVTKFAFYGWVCFSLAFFALHASETDSNSSNENCLLTGSLKNGLSFAAVPYLKIDQGAWICFSSKAASTDAELDFSLLTQSASFFGTQKYTREELVTKLNALGLDIDPTSFLQFHDIQHMLQMSLTDRDNLNDALELFSQIVFFPSLTDQEISAAKDYLLTGISQDNEKIRSVSVEEIQKFHANHFCPEKMHLTLVGVQNPAEFLPKIAEAFESEVKSFKVIPMEKPAYDLLDGLANKVEWANDHQTLIVDGKIRMKEPNWINKSEKSKTLGAILTALGLAGAAVGIATVTMLSFTILAPLAIVAGAISAFGGVYFLSSDYLKDPKYVEEIRLVDLKNNFSITYKKCRAGITLTPYERRSLFLQEMLEDPKKLKRLPILFLADLYQLNDPIIAEMFTVEELNVLTKLKRDFILQRNQYKIHLENLEREFKDLMRPYELAYEAALLRAQDFYNRNYYVRALANFQEQYNTKVDEIEKAFKNNDLNLKEKEELIVQQQAYLQACSSSLEFKSGLLSAETNLKQMKLDAEATYTYHIEDCKLLLDYKQKKNHYGGGEKAHLDYFSNELHQLLATFPVNQPLINDYLDLRN